MPQRQSSLCGCESYMSDGSETCRAGSESSQLAARQRYTISGQFPKHLTPPPSHPGSPRGSLEISAPPTPPYQRRYIAPVLHRAFTPDEDDVESDREAGESVELSLFPTSVYRSRADSKNTTKSARSGMSLPPCRDLRRSAELSHREATRSTDRQDFRQDSRSMTPDQRYANVAPMSAAFARLSHKDASEQLQRGRVVASKADLGAKMFEGAA